MVTVFSLFFVKDLRLIDVINKCLVLKVVLCFGIIYFQEQKKGLSAPPLKLRANQSSQGSAGPDILSCMLKDTTSEHKAHLFDLKCKICTGKLTKHHLTKQY